MSDDMKLVLDAIQGLREDMERMEASLTQKIENGDHAIRVILENDIIPKINIIAENHLDLYHRLENLQQDVQKYELLPVRVSLLEKEVFNQPKL